MANRRLIRALRSNLGARGVGKAIEGFTSESQVALTFDDGPDAEATQHVLEELAARGGRATFFVLMTRVRLYPTIVREILSEGHEVAFHGVDHADLATLSPVSVRSRLADGVTELEDQIQKEVHWFRPPYVSLSLMGWALLPKSPRFVASRSSLRDWEPLTDSERLAHFATSVLPGDVVLAHDSWPTSADAAFDGPEPHVDRRLLAAGALAILEERSLVTRTLSEIAKEAPEESAMRVTIGPRRA